MNGLATHDLMQTAGILAMFLGLLGYWWKAKAQVKADAEELGTLRTRVKVLEVQSEGHKARDEIILQKLDEMARSFNDMRAELAALHGALRMDSRGAGS